MDDLLKNLLKLAEGIEQFSDDVKNRSKNSSIRVETEFRTRTLRDMPPPAPQTRARRDQPSHEEYAEPKGNDTKTSTSEFPIKGLDAIRDRLESLIELNLLKPQILNQLGCAPQRGILCSGSPGTGKTALIKETARKLGLNFIPIVGSEIMAKHYGEAEEKLRRIFDEAKQKKPCIIFIDELDSIASNRSDTPGELEKRVVAQLLWLLDGKEGYEGVMLLAATNRPDSIDPALRRPGRLDVELQFPMPDREGRKAILESYFSKMPLAKQIDFDEIADLTPGFTGADLKSLAHVTAMGAIDRIDLKNIKDLPEDFQVSHEDLKQGLSKITPTMLRGYAVEFPKVLWNDIGGYSHIKERLRESLVLPLSHAKLFAEAHIKAPKGVLLWGPPGTGKTLLAKALASEAGANFISVSGPELATKWVGESERAIRELFSRARALSPCVLFFDELDTFLGRRGESHGEQGFDNRVIGQFLTEMDGIHGQAQILFVAATNRPDSLDDALVRPGRIDLSLKVDLPNEKERLEILEIHNRNRRFKNVDWMQWAKKTDGASGADLANFSNLAALEAVKRYTSHRKTYGGQTDYADFAIETIDVEKAFKQIKREQT